MKPAFLTRLARAATGRAKREEGAITVLSLQLLIVSMILGGFAVDVGHGFQTYTQLQATADSAAHAALLTREWYSADTAKTTAIKVATNMMPTSRYGDVLKPDDIIFGDWDADKKTFTANALSKKAVFVSTRRYEQNSNGLSTIFLRLAGQDNLDIASGSVWETYYSNCFREGIVAAEIVDTQSNNSYEPGYCIHAQQHVEINSNNVFKSGVIVSMPDKSDVVIPDSGYEQNTGLREALRDASYALRILTRIDNIKQGLLDPMDAKFGIMNPDSPYYRSYITSKLVNKINGMGKTELNQADFKKNQVNYIDCKNDNQHKQLKGDWLRQMAVVTDCRIQFGTDLGEGASLEDVVFLNTNVDDKSFYGRAGVRFGKDDDCKPGGDVQIVTKGGIDLASGIRVYGSQFIAAGDIYATANADGIEGASFVAGGVASITSNGAFGFCGGAGMGNNFEAPYFRMVL
ncbi:pilus assembly protein TadG-related protein [Albidovulum sediminicola]|uniref:Pilus assembly protein TadG-related protein n=1 Tax=Albidovulum sediminicola TaxID=2984331 RepID=A0ABT2Z0B4_9RHOB|nr:pilus assembly protein TadG-related protein [Defluviimonas sp. WL0075]MCV2864552.1 pilus assembly protein TadG-related protein [Defluviimonas sp. WL0075]